MDDKRLSDVEVRTYTPILDFYPAIELTLLSATVYSLSLFIHSRVFKFLYRKRGRPFNKLIFHQQICLMVCSIPMVISTVGTFVYPLTDFFSEVGCYACDFLQMYGVLLANSVSFYMALFRYLNIIHSQSLYQMGWTPEKLVNVILGCQYLVPLLIYILVRLFDDVTPYSGHDLLSCLGRYETGFLDDTKPAFCAGLSPWSPQGSLCSVLGIIYMMTSVNIPEAFLLWKIIQETKSQTSNVKDFLSLSSFEKRQREDGIMFTVNLWQWIVEVTFMIVFYTLVFVDFEKSELNFRILVLYIYFHMHLVNAFYLLGDSLFQKSVSNVGILKALYRAFLQAY